MLTYFCNARLTLSLKSTGVPSDGNKSTKMFSLVRDLLEREILGSDCCETNIVAI
jgi:hypothetical protein